MNDLMNFVNTLILLNPNNDLIISKRKYYINKEIKNINEKYKFNNMDKNKLYVLGINILKLDNKKLKALEKDNRYNENICNLIFNNIKNIKRSHIDNLSNLFIKYLQYEIKEQKLLEYISILIDLKIPQIDTIYTLKIQGDSYILNEKDAIRLHKFGLVEKLPYYTGNLEYKLTLKGLDFLDKIYLEPTKKEKEYYASKISYDKMNKLFPVLKHKKYYDEIYNQMASDDKFKKIARLRDQNIIKDFFEEYIVLIKYAITKYGENCKIKFCGNKTIDKIKYDGYIVFGDKEEKLEITAPFNNENKKDTIKELNRDGISHHKVHSYNERIEEVKAIMKNTIDKKNEKDSYDENINLVIFFDEFEFFFSEKLLDDKFLNSLFEDLKEKEYKFKNVLVLVDAYIGDCEKVPPRIITIK